MKHIIAFLTAILMLIFCACSGSESHKVNGDGEGWTIKGTIKGAADSTVYIESSTLNNWYPVDSLVLGSDETFSYTEALPDSIGNIYRVRLGSKSVYFPAIGKETVELAADIKNFDKGYSLSGSKGAESFARADALIAASLDSLGVDGTIANRALRNELNVMINLDETCLLSYYLINKRIGPDYVPFYNLVDPIDLKTLGNVANNFARLRPDDPRTKDLETLYLNARREVNRRKGRSTVIEVDPSLTTTRPEVPIRLYDAKGREQDFARLLKSGRPVVLNITRFDHKDSPANTIALNKIREQNPDVQIYQVSFDIDEMAWKQQALTMPWISVWATPQVGNDIMMGYNVNPNTTPTSFLFDSNGDLTRRVTDPAQLPAAVASLH